MVSEENKAAQQTHAVRVLASTRVILVASGYLAVTAIVFTSGGQGSKQQFPGQEAMLGRQTWLKNNCIACHTLYGLGGQSGPDLTNVLDRRDMQYNVGAVRYGRLGMPAFDLTDEEIRGLFGYIRWVGNTGRYPPKGQGVPAFGVIP